VEGETETTIHAPLGQSVLDAAHANGIKLEGKKPPSLPRRASWYSCRCNFFGFPARAIESANHVTDSVDCLPGS
jgi:hypothetical protein